MVLRSSRTITITSSTTRVGPEPPIAADPDGANVLYLGSLSKILAPGLRVGFIVASAPLMERLVALRLASDMQGVAAVEYAIAKMFEDGELLRHLRRMRTLYARRRDALSAALVRRLGSVVSFRVPTGGMALWVRVADEIEITPWEQAGRKLGVLFRGAGMLDFAGSDLPFLRLGFTYHDEDGAERSRSPDGPCPEAVRSVRASPRLAPTWC